MSAGLIGRRTFLLGSLALPALARAAVTPLRISGSAGVCQILRRAIKSPGIPHDLFERLNQAVFDGTSDAVTVANLGASLPPSLVVLDGPALVKAQNAKILASLPPACVAGLDAKFKDAVQGGAWLNFVRPWYAMAWSTGDPAPPDSGFTPWVTDKIADKRTLLLPPFAEANAPYLLWMAARVEKPNISLSDVLNNPDIAFGVISRLAHSRLIFDVPYDAMQRRLMEPSRFVAGGLPSSTIVPAINAGARESLFPLPPPSERVALPLGIAKTSAAPAAAAADDFLAALVAPTVQAALYDAFHEAPRQVSWVNDCRPYGSAECRKGQLKPDLPLPARKPEVALQPEPEQPPVIPDWRLVVAKFDDWSGRWAAVCGGCSH